MSRDLIIGMGDDTDQQRDATFLRSIERLDIDAEVHLFHADPLPWHPVVDRWQLIADYINAGDYDRVIACDTFDVVFQSNPFYWLDAHPADIVVVGEEKTFAECDGNKRGMMQSFPQYWKMVEDKEIWNAGVMAGKSEFVSRLCKSIYELCQQDIRLPVFTPKFEDRLPDQQALNIILPVCPYDAYIAHGKDAFAFQYNHKHRFADGEMYNEDGVKYAILHQYLYQWKEEVQRKYS